MKYTHIICMTFMVMLFSCSEERIAEADFGSIEGKVVNGIDFSPLANVKVFTTPGTSIVFTDKDGNFKISKAIVGNYAVQTQIENYISKSEQATVIGNGTASIVFELKTSTATNNKSPLTPALLFPLDNDLNQNIGLNLTWSDSDPDNDKLTYGITLRNDANSDVIVYSNIVSPFFTPLGLAYSTKYYWQVSVSDGINPLVWSSVRSFTTKSFPNNRFLFVKKVNSNNVIYTGDELGNELQITASDANSWRPRKNNQSKKIAFIRASGSQNHIYTMNPDGSGVFKVTNAVPVAGFNSEFINFSWNTSGNQILYPYFDKLYRINSDGTGLTKVFQTPNGKFISECDWSFDGNKIALKVNDTNGYKAEIYVINNSGEVINTVISGNTGAIGGLNFSATGKKLLFTRDVSGFEEINYRQLDTRIFECNFDSGFTYELDVEKPAGILDLDVRYSPNDAELLFLSTSNDGFSTNKIMKFTLGLTLSRKLLFSGVNMPDWE